MRKISYETNITKLREIVEKLESGEASLEESLKLFEQGIKLSNACTTSGAKPNISWIATVS